MSLHRYDAKRDANEKAIVAALEAVGVVVRRVSGEGVPDLLCWYRGRWSVLEVKMPKGRLRPAQEALYARAPFPIARTPEDALRIIGAVM